MKRCAKCKNLMPDDALRCIQCGFQSPPEIEHEIHNTSESSQVSTGIPRKQYKGCLTLVLLLILALVASMSFWFVVMNEAGPASKAAEIEFAPAVAALEVYKTTNGHYPDKLIKLLPTYLSVLPSCPTSIIANRPGGQYNVDPDSGDYELGCDFVPFQMYFYSSRTKNWRSDER